jgi:NAD(P)-dependent dehydrogenase (short-subunit alcohol dehydrogenase family)
MDNAIDNYGYEGKRVLVVGGASGIGGAAAQLVAGLGAEVVVADYAEVPFSCAQKVQLDLRHSASIAAAVEACAGPIDALFSCAGISEGADIMAVNVIGQWELIERCVDGGLMPEGSAIAMIASGAGLGWSQHLSDILELIDSPDIEAARAWSEAHPELASYAFSKEVVIAYCAQRAFSFMQKGIRINALCPTSTDTPLARRSFGWLEYGTDFRAATGIDVADPAEQAYPLAFLCSPAASYISGTILSVDAGLQAARLTGTFQPQLPSPPSA